MESLDNDVLERLGRDMGGSAGVSRIITMYLGKLPAETAALHDFADSGKLPELADAAHRVKSSTAMLGATGLAKILAGLEAAAKAGDVDGVYEGLAGFDEEAARVSAEMKLRT